MLQIDVFCFCFVLFFFSALCFTQAISMVCAAQIHLCVAAPIMLGDCVFMMQQAAKYVQSSPG